jgi:hypothetical protein
MELESKILVFLMIKIFVVDNIDSFKNISYLLKF